MARKNSLQAGDRIAYAAAWLRSTGQIVGDAGKRRGVVASRQDDRFVFVRWDEDVASDYAYHRETYAADPEYLAYVLANGTLVAEANLAKVPGRGVPPNRDFAWVD